MKQVCENCGQVHDEVWMMSYNTGRRTHWFCWECWKAGQGEAAVIEIKRKRNICKEIMKHKK